MSRIFAQLFLVSSIVIVGCNEQELKSLANHLKSETLIAESFELSPTDYKWYSFSPTKSCTLSLEVEVLSGESVNVDLLDPAEFKKWEESLSLGEYHYYQAFHGVNVLNNKFSIDLSSGGSYKVLIRPSKGIFGQPARVRTSLVETDK